MGDPRHDLLEAAGWTRRGPFYSPPGSQAKYTLAGAVAQLGQMTSRGPRPDATWKKAAIVDWLGRMTTAPFDPGATKAELLETVADLR